MELLTEILMQEGIPPVRYLVSDPANQARRPVPFLRIVGNLLILSGVLMFLGVGGWWGYTEWSNKQFESEFLQRGGKIEPTLVASDLQAANPTTVAPTPGPIALPRLLGDEVIPGVITGTTAENQAPVATPTSDSAPPTHLTIPSVGIDSKVVPVDWKMIPKPGGGQLAEWQVADYAVGHHKGSANPGAPGNIVMSGHVDYRGEVFKNLHLVKRGDEVIVQTEKGQFVYVITDMVIVQEDGASPEQKRRNTRYMDPTAEPTLTLITCYPYGIDDKRFIAIAHPYQPPVEQSEYKLR